MTTKDGTIGTTTTPTITGQSRAEQEKILQLAMQYLSDPWLTLKNPVYLYSQVGEPKPSRSFLRLPDQCWNLFFKVDVPIYMFNSDRVSPEAQAADGQRPVRPRPGRAAARRADPRRRRPDPGRDAGSEDRRELRQVRRDALGSSPPSAASEGEDFYPLRKKSKMR